MQIIPLNLDSVLFFLHNSKLAYWNLEMLILDERGEPGEKPLGAA